MPKISELTENTAPADGDLLVLVDVSDTPDQTEKITVANLHANIKAGDGTAAAPSYSFTSATGTGMSQASNLLSLSSSGAARFQCGSSANLCLQALWPNQDGTRDLGDATLRWNIVHTEAVLLKSHAAYAGSGVTLATAAVRTTDGTVTTLFSLTLSDNHLGWIEVDVVGRDEAGTERAYYKRVVRIHRQGAGAVIGTVATPVTDESAAGWDATIDASGNDIRVRVTGAAATNVSWVCTVRHQVVSTSA